MVSKPCFLVFSMQNQAESHGNYIKKCVLDPKRAKLNENIFLNVFLRNNDVFGLQTVFFYSFNVLLSFLAEKWYRTNIKLPQKISFGSETCEIDHNFDFGHVRTYSWLHKLRNTQGKLYETHLGNIYGIYKDYTGISIDIYDIKQSETQAPPPAAAPLSLCFWLSYIINI